MQVIPTMYFPGLCAEAISFYREHLGAEVLFQLTEGDAQPEYRPPGSAGKIIRAGLRIGQTTLYLSEGHHGGVPAFQGVSLVLQLEDQDKAGRIMRAFGEGGSVRVPLQETAWADCFGAVIDRFGVHWMVEVQGSRAPAAE